MFEQEVELEKHQSAAVPLLLIVTLILVVLGFAGYYVLEGRKVLTTPEAAAVVIESLAAQGPTTVSFHTGLIKPYTGESPRDARYRLLERAGVVKVGDAKGPKVPIELTPQGSDLLKQISGVKQSKELDGNDAYVVPLATRRLADIASVTMNGIGRATVEYTWKWEPNALGERFDTAGADMKSFSTWDRQALIDKHGARFYHEAPTKVVIALVKSGQGWQVAME